jgi:hypothetical protein
MGPENSQETKDSCALVINSISISSSIRNFINLGCCLDTKKNGDDKRRAFSGAEEMAYS